jgi:hypothetical protein
MDGTIAHVPDSIPQMIDLLLYRSNKINQCKLGELSARKIHDPDEKIAIHSNDQKQQTVVRGVRSTESHVVLQVAVLFYSHFLLE